MYRQVLDPVHHSLGLSAIFAALPLLTLFVLLGVLRIRAWVASLVALAVAFLVAVVVYPMPTGQALSAAGLGATFGLFPILWIVVNAIWVYTMTDETGYFDVLRRSFGRVSDDRRIQAIVVAFCFGALMEALAGFGTPVAITSVMLVAFGFEPLRAATIALVANTAPVAFGALAVPITTLSTVTGMSTHTLGSMVGRQTPILAVFVPLVLVFIVDGRRGVRETWVPALTCGVVFGLVQYATSNFISVQLADIGAALVSAAAVILVLRTRPAGAATPAPVAGAATDEPHPTVREPEPVDSRAAIWTAYAPYLIIIVIFVVAQWHPILNQLDKTTRLYHWPGLHIQNAAGKASTLPVFKFNWLTAAGSLMFIAGVVSAAVLRLSPVRAARAYWRTLVQLRWAILTVATVLALAYMMNGSGQTQTLGSWMAKAGGLFALLSPLLGWLGVAVTGSDTSSNALFGALQVSAAHQADLNATLTAGANSSGGVLGKMISPQNLAIATAAVGLAGREGDVFRLVIRWSVLMVAGMCVLVYLQSTGVLSWMVP
jgi:lactate permease